MGKNSYVRKKTGNSLVITETTEISPSSEDTTPLPEDAPAASEQKVSVEVSPQLPPVSIDSPRKSWARSATVSSKNDWRRNLLFIILTTALLLFFATGVSYVVLGADLGSPAVPLTSLQPKSTALVTITPLNTVVKHTYTISMVTGQPEVSQQQAAGVRTISNSASQALQVNATGKITTPATSATGTLTFFRATKTVTIPAGTPFLAKNNIALVLNAPVTLTAKGRAVSMGAHANPPGSKGNVPALYINGIFCYPNCFIGSSFHLQNTAAFVGGKDAQSYTFVQQSDINNAAGQLESSIASIAQAAVQSQIKSTEQVAGSISCRLSFFSSNQQAGARVPNVTVSATETCSGEVYTTQSVQALAAKLLKRDVTTLVGPGYVIVGNVATQLLTQPKLIDSQGTLSVNVAANGTALYQFTTIEQQAFAKLIAGKSIAVAKALLLSQFGVAQATINILSNSASKLPKDPGQITVLVVNS